MRLNIRRKFRKKIRNISPVIILRLFRTLRSVIRRLFVSIINSRNSRKYQSLILNKYPNLHSDNQESLVLDLGANLGHFAAACHTLGYTTVCVEPHPDAISYLESRFVNNPKFSLFSGAITSDGSPVLLQLHPDHDNDPLTTSLSASIIEEKFLSNHRNILVAGFKFETFFSAGQVYEIVKIDIEGAELFLFDDLVKFSASIKRLLLETHSRYMLNTQEGEAYRSKLEALESFIREKNLGEFWFTDWI